MEEQDSSRCPPPGLALLEEEKRRELVGSFLLSSFRTAAGRYAKAAECFSFSIQKSRDFDFADFDEADRVVEMFETTLSMEGWAAAALLASSFQKQFPRRSYWSAWKCLDVWKKRFPSREAPAMPAALACAAASWLRRAHKSHVIGVALVCFSGLPRVRRPWP